MASQHPQHPFIRPAQIFLIGSMLILTLVLLVLLSMAVGSRDFLVIPLTLEWFRLMIAGVYLLVQGSYARGTLPSIQTSMTVFGAEFILGFVSALVVTIRAWGFDLCEDFHKFANPCNVALTAMGLAWLTTSAALVGVLLLCAEPVYRLYLRLRLPKKPKVSPNAHVIELADMPNYNLSADGEKEQWTEIPV